MKAVLFSVAVCVIHSLLTSSKIAEGRLLKGPSFCSLKSDEGPCRGYFQNWYYHESSGECKTFIYGGCPGNKNRFETKEECEKTCKVKDKMTKHLKDSNSHKSSLDMRTFWDHHRNKLFIKKWLTRKRRDVAQNRLPEQKRLELNPEGSQGSQNDPIENMLNNAMSKHDPKTPDGRNLEEGGKQDRESQRRKTLLTKKQALKSDTNRKGNVKASKKSKPVGQMSSADSEESTGEGQTMSSATRANSRGSNKRLDNKNNLNKKRKNKQQTDGGHRVIENKEPNGGQHQVELNGDDNGSSDQSSGQITTENRKPASNHQTNVGNNKQSVERKKPTDEGQTDEDKEPNGGQHQVELNGDDNGSSDQSSGQRTTENRKPASNHQTNVGNNRQLAKANKPKATDDNGSNLVKDIANVQRINDNVRNQGNRLPVKNTKTTDDNGTRPNGINQNIPNLNGNENVNRQSEGGENQNPAKNRPFDPKKKKGNTTQLSQTQPNSNKTITKVNNHDLTSEPTTKPSPVITITDKKKVSPTPTISATVRKKENSSNENVKTKNNQTTTVPTTREKTPEQDKQSQTTTEGPLQSNKTKPVEGPRQQVNKTNPVQGPSQQVNKTKPVQGPSQQVNTKEVETMQPTTTASPSQTKKPEPGKGSGQGANKKKEENNQATTAASPVPSKKTKEPTEEPEEDQQTPNHGGNEDNGNPATDEDASSDVNRIPSDKSGNRAGPRLRIRPVGDEEVHTSSHFAAFFLSSIVAVFAVYFIYHNRQKIVAIVIEGRSVSPRRGAGYRKLETNVEEAMPTMKKYVA